MNDEIKIKRVEKFFSTSYVNNLSKILIFQNENGEYELFNKYLITKENETFKIHFNSGTSIKLFSSLRHAVTWCVFDNKNKFSQAKRIEYLDKMIAGADVNITIHKRLIDRTNDLEHRLIYVSKLSQEQAKKQQMLEEVQDFILQSKRLQTKKFASK